MPVKETRVNEFLQDWVDLIIAMLLTIILLWWWIGGDFK
jgi:hypothetical protein